ncbi:MAG: amidase domain-containing protein [Chloroflexota bacterium]
MRGVGLLITALALPLPLLFGSFGKALAYDGSRAALYADIYWNAYNTSFPSYADDCTNFVSQAMSYGGDQQENLNYLPQDDWAWYMYFDLDWNHTNSWTVAGDNWQWLYNSGRAYLVASYSGAQYTSNHTGAYAGDEIYYAWYYHRNPPDAGIKHMSIQVNDGYDERGNWTSIVDSHTTNRYHVNWTLFSYNQYANTTQIYVTHHT